MSTLESSLSNIAQDIKKTISLQYKKASLDWHNKQRQRLMQQQAAAARFGQIYMQEGLGQVLSKTKILPNLCQISSPSDLVPAGCTISNGHTIYHYRWLKTAFETVTLTVLEKGKEKINDAIAIEQFKMNRVYGALPDYEKPYFAQEYPAFYTGFHVVGLKDAGADIIVSAVFY